MQTIEIGSWKIQKVLDNTFMFTLPTEPQYFHQFSQQRSVLIEPHVNKNDEIISYFFTTVTTSIPFKVEYFQIYVSHFNISYNGTAWGHEELVKQWIDNKLTLISKELFNERIQKFLRESNITLHVNQ